MDNETEKAIERYPFMADRVPQFVTKEAWLAVLELSAEDEWQLFFEHPAEQHLLYVGLGAGALELFIHGMLRFPCPHLVAWKISVHSVPIMLHAGKAYGVPQQFSRKHRVLAWFRHTKDSDKTSVIRDLDFDMEDFRAAPTDRLPALASLFAEALAARADRIELRLS